MMKKIYFLTCFLFFGVSGFASHIVGGEITMRHAPVVGNVNSYIITLRYFRDKSGGPPVPASLVGGINQKSNGASKLSITANLIPPIFDIQYDDEDCVPNNILQEVEVGILSTIRLTLLPSNYNSATGYYIWFEDFARNQGLINYAGDNTDAQYYMEFPSLALYPGYDSPKFNKDPITFALEGKQFKQNYLATQLDNDSLSYDIISPLLPGTNNQADAPVPFNPGYSLFFNYLNSLPSDALDMINVLNGDIAFTPLISGKYLFAIRVSHYDPISGVKIGEIRREFQFQVFENTESPPIASDDQNSTTRIEYEFFAEEEREVRFTIKDDPKDSIIVRTEAVSGANYPFNFGAVFGTGGGLPGTSDTINQTGPQVTALFNWTPPCNSISDSAYRFTIISRDNTCPSPFIDTINVFIFVRARDNNRPYFSLGTDTPLNTQPLVTEIRVKGDQKTNLLEFFALDSNIKNVPFVTFEGDLRDDPDRFSRVTLNLNQAVNQTRVRFEWQTTCADIRETPYLVKFKVRDLPCPNSASDSSFYFLLIYVDSPFNAGPVISSISPPGDIIKVKVGETLSLPITVRDTGDVYNIINLEADLTAFAGSVNPATFANVVGALDSATSVFSWTPDCTEADTVPYKLIITTYDNGCPVDTNKRTYFILVEREDNDNPLFSFGSSPIKVNVNAGDQYTLNFTSDDDDTKYNFVKILARSVTSPDVFSSTFFNGPTFTADSGINKATASFEWNTRCENAGTIPYLIEFLTFDDLCPFPDTTKVTLEITIIPAPNDAPTLVDVPATIINQDLYYKDEFVLNFAATDLQSGQILEISSTSDLYNNPLIINKPVFTTSSQVTIDTANASFTWTPDCALVNDTAYVVRFVVRDFACPFSDSTVYIYNLKVIENPAYIPTITVDDPTVNNDTVKVIAGSMLSTLITSQNEISSSGVIISASSDLFNFSPNPAVFTNNPNAEGKAEGQLSWQTECANLREEAYTVTFKSFYGDCVSDTVTKVVYVKVITGNEKNDDVPNVFTPNGDGKNDQYSIVEKFAIFCDTEFSFLIFDRWGKKVFESTDPAFRWDGDEKADGTYFYVLKSKAQQKTGSITLLR